MGTAFAGMSGPPQDWASPICYSDFLLPDRQLHKPFLSPSALYNPPPLPNQPNHAVGRYSRSMERAPFPCCFIMDFFVGISRFNTIALSDTPVLMPLFRHIVHRMLPIRPRPSTP